ncbi:MAG: hypothetical protein J4O06_07450, partial [Chloroflexi bacterium]|nr:hypothetical protein [Chloroflexota bacterium]MCI0798601.1 hypothetical protein [Chloroflexota bacterium]
AYVFPLADGYPDARAHGHTVANSYCDTYTHAATDGHTNPFADGYPALTTTGGHRGDRMHLFRWRGAT